MDTFRILYNYQAESKKEDCVIFPNAVYEIQHGFISEAGIKHILDPFENHNPKRHASAMKYEQKLSFHVDIPISKDTMLFSLWSKLNVKRVFFHDYTNDQFDILFKKPTKLRLKIEERIEDEDVALSDFYDESAFWCTTYDAIKEGSLDLQKVIYQLGLDHYCHPNNFDCNNVAGLVFKVKHDKLLKPNFLCSPSRVAYCGKPEGIGLDWGATVNIDMIERGVPEALVPHKYFREMGLLEVVDIILYDVGVGSRIDQKSVIQYVHQQLDYNSNDDIEFSQMGAKIAIRKV